MDFVLFIISIFALIINVKVQSGDEIQRKGRLKTIANNPHNVPPTQGIYVESLVELENLVSASAFNEQYLEYNAEGQSCYLGYYHCTGYDWCCQDAYICTGSTTCLSIGVIVGACIGAIAGLVFFIVLIYLCCRSKKGTVGTVVAHPGVHTTVGQQQYGQPPAYGQPQYGQPSGFAQPGPDPAYPPTKQ